MDLKALLGKLDVLEGSMEQAAKNPTGPKFTGQWKGTDKGTPGKKLVGDSILKDLSKGLTPKTREQELAEEFKAFLEAEFKDTVEKRPARKNARPARGHEPQPRYKTVKADESSMSEKDIELQDYRSMSHKEFQTAYGMTKTEWINKNKSLVIQNPDIKRSLGINESHYKWEITFKNGKKAVYHHDSLTYSDVTAANDIEYTKKSNPGSTIVATKDGKPFDWESLLSEDLNEDGYYGPVEARWMVELSDDEGTHLKTYVDKFPSLSAAKKAYKNTPYASNFKYTPVKKDTNEAIDSDIVQPMGQDAFNRAGYNPIRDERDYLDRLSKLRNLELKPGLDQSMKDEIIQRKRDLNAEALKKGYIKAESRGHKIVANKLKDIERAKKFASGELKIPTPQERQAQLKKLEKAEPVKEYGEDNISPYGQPTAAPAVDLKQLAQGSQALKAATGSTAPAPNIAKAIDALSQGKLPTQQQVKDMQPMMKDIDTAMQSPQIAGGSLKTAFQQANQAQLKQQQQTKK